MLLRDSSQRSKFSDASIRENHIDSPLRLDYFVEKVKVGHFGNVSLNANDVGSDCLHSFVEFLSTTARYKYVSPFFDEELCCGQPYPGRATGNDCDFPLQLLR